MVSTTTESRLEIKHLLPENTLKHDEENELIKGLTQKHKSIPCHYFYDEVGSRLFEQICELPEYYPTRTEAGILAKYAPKIAQLAGISELIELGSGSSTKTRFIFNAYQNLGYPLHYLPIDVSDRMLFDSAKNLLLDYPTLTIDALASTYEVALEKLTTIPRILSRRMIIFLGSTLGNFTELECDRLLQEIKESLTKGDYFLLGIDLQKPTSILNAAYNDSQAITAKFNLNILNHLNWRFAGNFDLNNFEHLALYNEKESQIEMYLKSKKAHCVKLKKLDLEIEFREGERIHTEISRKFNRENMSKYLTQMGLKTIQIFTDPDEYFGLILSQIV
jgi:dimethylhistidine N-methyltransferase